MPDRLEKSLAPGIWWFCAAAIIAWSVAVSISFARVQSIWGDETTQLAGITLSPMEALRWLAGTDPYRFGVPPDRMPPLSYWAGIAWASVFGTGTFAMRLLSIAASVPGLVALAATLRRISPTAAALAVLGLFALSLNFFHYSTEIRTYPFVLALASTAIYTTSRYLEARANANALHWLLLIAAICAVMTGFHYTSFVFAIALLGSLGLLAIFEGRNLRPLIGAALLPVLAIAALVPLVQQQMQVKNAVLGTSFTEMPRFFFRLVASRADSVFPVILITIALAKAALVATSGWAALQNSRPLSHKAALWFICAIASVAGIIGMALGGLFLPVSMLQPHYSIWLWPMVAILMLCQFPASSPVLRWAYTAALAVAMLCTLVSQVVLFRNMPAFVHGPDNEIARIVDQTAPDAPIIYDFNDYDYWNAYYPMRLAYGQERPQYFVKATAEGVTYFDSNDYLEHVAGKPMPPITSNPIADAKELVFVRATMFEFAQLRAYLHDGTDNLPDTGSEELFAKAQGMEIVSKTFAPGITSARIIVMRKK